MWVQLRELRCVLSPGEHRLNINYEQMWRQDNVLTAFNSFNNDQQDSYTLS